MYNTEDLKRGYETSSIQLDKIVITISSGAIVLSVTFIEKINACHTWVLKSSWVFFAISIVSVTLSYRNAISLFRKQILNEKTSKFKEKFVDITNFIACYSMIIGIIFSIAFAWVSISA